MPLDLASVRVAGHGPLSASIVVVIDAVTPDDAWKQKILGGKMGDFYLNLLSESGIIPAEVYFTSVLKKVEPKPDELYSQTKTKAQKLGLSVAMHETWVHPRLEQAIHMLREELSLLSPRAVIAVGDLAMFACAGVYGSVDTWRGSLLEPQWFSDAVVVPTYPPAEIMKRWEIKGFCARDLARAKDASLRPQWYRYPTYDFIIRPSFEQAQGVLLSLLAHVLSGKRLKLSCDVETIARMISCVGIAWSAREAMCIPFMGADGHYWEFEEEFALTCLLKELLTHPNTEVVGQNFNYDHQHFAKHYGFLPRLTFDTMIAQHVLFPGLPKALDFLSSMYCHWHRYWKDELNDYSRLPANLPQYWTYNCKDCVVTFEVAGVLDELLDICNRRPQFEFMMETGASALQMMLRGIRVDQQARGVIASRLMEVISEYDALIQDIVGFPLNVGSAKQMKDFFYGELQLPVQLDKKTKQPTLSSKALGILAQKEPILGPLVELIEKKRSVGVFLKTFCLMPLDTDGRMRCSFNACGTETFRFSSSENAMGSGGNLQNLPQGEDR
jgi:uracil-DNA glycosylase